MRYSLVELLRTPITGQPLHLEVFATRTCKNAEGWARCRHYCSRLNCPPFSQDSCRICGQEEVIEGRLISEDGREQYPIIEGIPRLLPQEYMGEIWKRYPLWLKRYGTACHSVQSRFSNGDIKVQRQTAQKFSREWQTFDKMLHDFDGVFRQYFDLVDLDLLGDKTVLDAGCGMGRWAFHIAPKTNRVIAFDLSFAVEPAYSNCYGQGNVQVIQADIFHLPLQSRCVDFIYSLGVLHHLTDPYGGFLSLRRLLSRGGKLLTYVYYNLENRPTYFRTMKKAVDLLRQFTAHSPASLSYPIAFVVAFWIYLPLIWFGGLLRGMGLTNVDHKIPLYQTYKGKSLHLILNDAVDRLTAPIEKRYSREEIARWFSGAGFCNVRFSNSPPYWKSYGKQC